MTTLLPHPARARWQPLRAGLVDLFYYDQYYGYYNTPGHSLEAPEVRA